MKVIGVIKRIIGAFTLLSLIFGLFATSPVSVHAQGAGSNFSECRFSTPTQGTTQNDQLILCMRQIYNFIFFIGIILIIYRIAVAALDNFDPTRNGRAVDNSIKAIRDIVTGLIILGGFYIFLNTLNPALLMTNFLEAASRLNPSQSTTNNQQGSNTNEPNLNESVQNLNNRQSYNQPNSLFLINTYAQSNTPNNSPSKESIEKSRSVVQKAINELNFCKTLFVPASSKSTCITSINENEPILNKLDPSIRAELTVLTDADKEFSGSLVTLNKITILNTLVPSYTDPATKCVRNWIHISIESYGEHVLTTLDCGGVIADNTPLLKRSENGSIIPNIGIGIDVGTQISGQGRFISLVN